MNSLANLFRTRPSGDVFPPLEDNGPLGQFRAWERGFDAHISGRGQDSNCEHGRARPLWRDGWHAAERVEQLREEQTTNVSHL